MKFKELLALARARGVEFRLTEVGEFAYLEDVKSGFRYPLPELSLDQPVSKHVLEWIVSMSGLDPALDLLQDPDSEK